MDVIGAGLLLCSSVSAAIGTMAIMDFAFWEARGTKSAGEIEGFVKKTDKGKHLPVISFVTEQGPQKKTVSRIDQMVYVMGKPRRGNIVNIIYLSDEEGNVAEVRVHGYLNVVAGALMVIPFIIVLGYLIGHSVLMTQGIFLLILLGIAGGGMVLMQLIQRIY